MKRITAVFFLLIGTMATAQSATELTRGAKMYIQPFGQFETYLGAAFSKKHVPVTIVSSVDQADLTLAILNDGQQVTGIRVEGHDNAILWTYLFPKPGKAQLKLAEKAAGELRHQFPLSPEEQAQREQREAQRAEFQAQLQDVTILNGNYRVQPGAYVYFPFQVTQAMILQGNFEVAGGAGNDIQVVVGPRTEVLNWLNGHGGALNYGSDKLTAGDLNVSLTEPGEYLIAFNNRFSVVSAKMVAANVQLVAPH